MQHRHSETRFPLTGRHALADCQACHWNGQLRGLETACASCHVDDYEGTMDPSHIAAGFSLACESCHSAQITDWAAPGFVHGDEFPLTAGHSGLRCVSCHSDAAYATTETACIACHRDDYEGVVSPNHHANGYPENCLECHTTSNWDATFNHNNTQFPLTGAHVQTSCQQCHVGGVFEGTPGQCIDCHLADYNGTTDPDHAAVGISTACLACHTTESWDMGFDHQTTNFPLTGAHVQTSCQQCHVGGVFEGTPGQCIDCHLADYNGTTDPDHAAVGISTACLACHTTESWDMGFDHQTTNFPLTGAHVQTSCQQCHVGGVFEGTPGQCIDCHLADYNGTTEPDHAAAQMSTACLACHTTESWDMGFDHQTTNFPLTGAHVQTSCQQCHVGGVFEGTPGQCIDCHLADYNGTTDPDHEAAQMSTACLECHTTSNWNSTFNHNNTQFPLTGAHVQTSCQQCHVGGVFEGTPGQCIDCHLADYNGTTDPDHAAVGISTACLACHTTESWDMGFDHQTTNFPLTGAHVQTSCQQCHVGGVFEGTPGQCIDCHLADYNGTTEPDHAAAQFPTTCQTCHSTSNWNSTFNHSNTNFPLTGAHIQTSCQQCHVGGVFEGTSGQCIDCHLADYNSTSEPDHEAVGISTACLACHTTESWDMGFDHQTTNFPLTGAHVQTSCQQCHVGGVFEGTPG
ncbi:hypothetical protein KJZ99_08265, partial [bacterium]|nr:hypothetical protein [bacterium]